jgi:hypothetical protein
VLDLGFPRDLVMIGAIFGVAAFVWAGWAQEQPPGGVGWRIALAVLSALGLALAAVSIPVAIANWGAGSAFSAKTAAFVVYVVVFWVEVAIMIGLSIWANVAGRSDLIAPLILAVVGVHFLPLAWVFGQPLLAVVGVVLAAAAVFAAFTSTGEVARSFWCGVIAAPVLVAAGAWCTAAGIAALRAA